MIADRITVLKDGIKVACHNAGEVTQDQLIREMVGRDASAFYKKPVHSIGEVVLQVRNYSRHGAVEDVSFDLRQGEILGVAGMVGSGRTELARLIFAADKKDSGELHYKGKKIKVDSPADAIEAGICLIPEDRQRSGLILKRSIKDNIIIAGLNRLRGFLLSGGEEKTVAENYIKLLAIRTPSHNQLVQFLSGGNQQKVVLTKWLFVDADVFIFDEPTRGRHLFRRFCMDQYVSEADLLAGLESIKDSPKDQGLLELIVIRPCDMERIVLPDASERKLGGDSEKRAGARGYVGRRVLEAGWIASSRRRQRSPLSQRAARKTAWT